MSNPRSIPQPRQKLPYSKKTKSWRKANIDYADGYSFYNNESVRQSLANRIVNQNLYEGKLDMNDLISYVNPYDQQASFIPNKVPHHPIIVPKIDLLVGEEARRVFDWKAIVTNPNAISLKEEDRKDTITSELMRMLQENYNEEQLEAKLEKFGEYMRYDWQDLRERMANQILKHYWHEQDFKSILNKCFKDSLIHGEELAQIEIIHNEPILTKLNPLKVHSIRSGNSDKIEDSSLIIIEDHWSPGKIVDYFHDELKSEDIDKIMEYNEKSTSKGSYTDDYNHTLLRDALDSTGNPFIDDLFSIAEINGHRFSTDLTDENGNIRVFRVYWKSLKKIKKVKYYDENGDTQYKIRSEEYIEDETLGEESETMWVNEMWQGNKIGKDIYIAMKPCDVQYTKASNPSYCHAGIIGQVFNTNQGRAVSLIDRMKSYQYLYDVNWDRLNKAISTNYGKMMELDLAKVPEGWEIEKWLHFAIVNKIAVVDSFKEGNKGAATGRLAGGMNTQGGRSIDMETGNYIQSHIAMLEFIKQEMSEIAGVTKQREGQISNRETVGGVERSVNQSANITEYWFNIHESFKIRVLTAFLEAAKIALKDNTLKAQYILDDMSIQILNADGEELSEADFGIVVSNSSKATELEQNINMLGQAFLQNGGNLSTVMDMFMSDSIAEKRAKLKQAEDDMREEAAKDREEQFKAAQMQIQAEQQDRDAERELKDLMNQRDNNTKLLVEQMKQSMSQQDLDGDGILDPTTNSKLEFDREKLDKEIKEKQKDRKDKMKMHKDKLEVENKKISVQARKKVNSN